MVQADGEGDWLDRWTVKLERVGGIAARTYEAVLDDLDAAGTRAGEKVQGLVDRLSEDPVLKDLGGTVSDYASQGWGATRQAIATKAQDYNAWLDAQVQEHPRRVGVLDGFTSVYLDTAVERRARSALYKEGVAYGRALGVASAVLSFKRHPLIATMPLWARLGSYIGRKVAEAVAEPIESVS